MKRRTCSYQQSRIAMAVFGGMAFILGITTIFHPSYMVERLNLFSVDTTELRSIIVLSGIASTNMGAYYLYMAYHRVIIFFKITIVFRLLITVPVLVYWCVIQDQDALLLIALWEGFGALWVLLALIYDNNRLLTKGS